MASHTLQNELPLSTMDPVLPHAKAAAKLAPPMQSVKTNERRSRMTFAIIVLLSFFSLSLAGAVIGSAILGFATFGLFKSANYFISTYVNSFC